MSVAVEPDDGQSRAPVLRHLVTCLGGERADHGDDAVLALRRLHHAVDRGARGRIGDPPVAGVEDDDVLFFPLTGEVALQQLSGAGGL